eukprot:8060965-Pyramimonas_sp.AAC.1
MQTAENAASLALKLTKCLLVPLHAPFTEQLATSMCDLIRAVALFFANIQVVRSLVYHGLVMGPAADESSCWLAPSIKVKLRSILVGGSPLAVSRPAVNYTTRIAP